jgi:hypothetical protein
MQILSKCIKRIFRKHNNTTINHDVLTEGLCKGLNYECSDVYLGKKGTCTLNLHGYTIYLYYSTRDGIGWKLKCINPYAVLFDYNDGAYFINDPSQFDYSQLLSQLCRLQPEVNITDHTATFRRLEEITAQFIQAYFR